MEPTSRRSFAKGLGLLGLLSVGVAGYKEATSVPTVVYKQDELPTKELEAQLSSPGVAKISMQAVYGTPKPHNPYSINFYGMNNFVEGTRKEVWVDLVPGPDGKLYVKENDIWRKI